MESKEVDHMNQDEMKEFALFKFSLIAPIVNNTYVAPSQRQYLREIASKTHTLPNGKKVKYTADTIKKWLIRYRKGGFDSLLPKSRSDIGISRVLDSHAMDKIHDIKERFPYITGKLVYQKLIEEGYVKVSQTSMASVLRYIRENNLKGSPYHQEERKAYEMEFANDCWQSDTSHGAIIKVNGQKRQTYLTTIIDDASRIIAHGEFFFHDNAVNMQNVFKKAIAKYGLPKRLFVDNGSPFKNDQLRLICASLGILLIHTSPYSPESKGKVERVFRTIKDNWLNGTDWNEFHSLEALNASFNKYLTENYMNKEYSALQMTPRVRYLQDAGKIKFIPPEEVEKHFLHRVTRKVHNDATIKLQNIFFEVPQKYIRQKINIRYSPYSLDLAYIFNQENKTSDTIYPLKKVDNSKVKRKTIDYTTISLKGGDSNV
jgi:putative transposase